MFELCFTICLYLLASAVISTYIFSGGGRSYHLLLSLLVQKEFLAQHIWRATWFIGLGAGFWLALKSISAEKKLRLLEKEKFLQQLHEAELQQEIVISQLAFFKSQINPHFLFNTINFFYASIYPLSKPLAKSILMLSNIMRYAMNSDNKSVWADLITEIEVIEDFIKLNQLRFDSKLQINFIINGQPEHQKIISFLMMTLVENAFKYGDLEDAKNPLSIVIDIFEDKVNMQIQNKISNHKVENGHGIGIKNLENRLKLAYQDNYFFLITKSESVYKCDLMLNFY